MIIGIDAREGLRTKRAGKGEYVYELVSRLIDNNQHSFVLFLDCQPLNEWRKPNVRFIVLRVPAGLWQLLVFLYLEFLRPVDVYFATTSLIIPALLRSIPTVTTLFDFVSFLFPESHQRKAVILEKIWMRGAISFSKKLIAISEHTKRDATKLFKVNPHKITVTHLAPSLSEGGRKVQLNGQNIILFIGTLEPRKNISRLVEAFNRLRNDNITSTLILVGSWGWQSKGIKRAINQSPFREDIQVLGYMESVDKSFIYRQAAVFAFPSLYEGFGLPPLEAMACGIPVVTSNVSSLPEVVGDAAVLVDPSNIDEIYQALKRILIDRDFADQLVIKGRAQVKKFDWQRTADQTMEVLIQ